MHPSPTPRHPHVRHAARAAACCLVLALGVPATASATPSGGASPVDPPFDPADAETLWRWIGIRDGSLGSCPPPPSVPSPWQVAPLFAKTGRAGWLDLFCVYTYGGSGSVTGLSDLTSLVSSGLLTAAAPDRMVVSGLGEPLLEALWPVLADELDRQVGRVPLPLVPEANRARLTIVDTSPTTGMNPSGLPESSPHGATLRRFARHFLCSTEDDCVADLATRLALGYKEFERDVLLEQDEETGGYFGTLSELARAIWLAAEPGVESGQRQVVNLSVAWDPIFGGLEAEVGSMPPDVQAVFQAIRAAACSGAVVVAAAGNLADELGPTQGPLLPAAWTERHDPSGDFCAGEGPYTPRLLYAVGGVDSAGEPLTNARPGSAAELAAYADHAVIADPETGEPTEVLTGSSVAALVVSATAAAAAYYRPDLSTLELMEEIHTAGDPLGRVAEICHGAPPCPGVSYVSLCRTVAHLCSDPTVAFCPPATPACPPRPLQPPPLGAVDLSAFFDPNGPALTLVDGTDIAVPVAAPFCGAHEPLVRSDAPPVDPCPHRQHHGLGRRPWTNPQPGSDPCPHCTLFPTPGTLAMQIAPGFEGTLSDPTLVLCPWSTNARALSLGSGLDLEPGLRVSVTGLPVGWLGCSNALLSFTVTDGNGVVSTALSSVLVSGP